MKTAKVLDYTLPHTAHLFILPMYRLVSIKHHYTDYNYSERVFTHIYIYVRIGMCEYLPTSIICTVINRPLARIGKSYAEN